MAMTVGLAACSAPAAAPKSATPVEVQLVAFNDFHGNLEAPAGGWKTEDGRIPAGGAARFASHVAKIRAENENTVVVSAGDLIGASPLVSALFHDEPTIEAMNAIGLDINGVGNHEFDEGAAELRRIKSGGCHPKDGCAAGHDYAGAKFSFLAANAVDTKTNETVFPAYEVREFDGVKIAFIGLTLEGTRNVVPPVIPEIRFDDEADTVNRLVKKLGADGVKAYVVLLHEGGFTPGNGDCGGISGPVVDVVKRFHADIDVVVSGHTHQAYICNVEGKVVTSAGSFGRMLTDLDITLDPSTGDVSDVKAKNLIVTHDLPEETQVASIVADYVKLAAPKAKRVVGQLATPLPRGPDETGQSALGQVIADSQLDATRESAGAQIAFMNIGGVRVSLEDAGPLTYEDLFSVQPFGNTLTTVSLSGAQLVEALEAQWSRDDGRPRFLQGSAGFAYSWNPDAPAGRRVPAEWVMFEGKPLDMKKTYRVTINSYMSNLGVWKEGTDRTPGELDLLAFERYLAKNSPLSAPKADRIAKRQRASMRIARDHR